MSRETFAKTAPGAAMPWRRTSGVLAFALLGALTGCEKEAKPAEAPVAQPAPQTRTVTLLVTGSANGQLLPSTEGEKQTGGAAELMGRWRAEEKHCVGPVDEKGQAACESPATLALAIGDHWNGPALSSFFYGETTAAVMRQMGFAASALGNHELDYGREQFLKNREIGGFPFLAANLKVKDEALAKDWELPGFKVFERQGMKVGVVGLTPAKTVSTAMAGRADGLEVVGYEEALSSAVPEARKAGADAVVVVADVCPTELEPVLSQHPEWKVSLVAGGRCRPAVEDSTKAGTTYVSLGRGFGQYLRASFTFDPSKPDGERVEAMETKRVEVTGGEGAPEAFGPTTELIAELQKRLDKALGEEIGFTKKGLAQDSKELGLWAAKAMQATLETDGAILNRNGFRQGLAAGPVTKGSVYSVLPYENSLLVVKLKGEDLAKQLSNEQAVFAGFKPAGKGKFKDAKGKPLDPKKEYKVATVEYLYFGGDGFEFEKLDPEPGETGMSWQTPVIEWTRKQATSKRKPLEKLLRQAR